MGRRGQQYIAFALIILGAALITANIVGIDPDRLFWPLVLIAIGVLLIVRPKGFRPGDDVKYAFAGDYVYGKNWEVKSFDLRFFAGDVMLDLKEADFPDGETLFTISSFANEVDLQVPPEVGLKVVTNTFVTDAYVDGIKKEYVFSGFTYKSDNYETAAKKFKLVTNCFVTDIKLR